MENLKHARSNAEELKSWGRRKREEGETVRGEESTREREKKNGRSEGGETERSVRRGERMGEGLVREWQHERE
jgi:hypothetical protein